MNIHRLGRLRWKLTLSYTLVTVGALLVVELLLIGGSAFLFDWLLVRSGLLPQITLQIAQESHIPTLRPYLAQSPPNLAGIDLWLQQFEERTASEADAFTVLVLDREGRLLRSFPGAQRVPDPALEPILAAARAGEIDPGRLVWQDEDRRQLWLAAPIFDRDNGEVLGVLVETVALPRSSAALIGEVLPLVGISLIVLTLAAGMIGTLFGGLTARGLVQRLSRLAEATDAWSRGDFSAFIVDRSADELGQLGRRLNRMAEQLQNLLATRQQLAVLEERNRLARDLHDSAKQQAFAVAAQVAAARALVHRDPEVAERRLAEAEHLAYTLRQELTNLVYELRPAALAGKGLAEALRIYAEEWSTRNPLEVNVEVQGARALTIEVEQALFRIAQEALTNIARHSNATSVEIHLICSMAELTLEIRDDGRGFDPQTVRRGIGLDSMEERAAAVGAALTVESRPGEGARVKVRVDSSRLDSRQQSNSEGANDGETDHHPISG